MQKWVNKWIVVVLNEKQQTEEEISHSKYMKYMESLFICVIFDIANTTNPIYIHQKDGKLKK